LGDTGAGWADVGPQLSASLPHARFIFPTAPQQPVTLNGGSRMTAWFDITSLSDIEAQEDEAGLNWSVDYTESLVTAEVAAGVLRSRVVLAGFSQGGAVALLAGLRSPAALGGVVALSTWLPLAKSFPAQLGAAAREAPIFMAHGTQDQVVRPEYGQRSCDAAKALGVTASMQLYRMPHSATPEELADVTRFLLERLPPVAAL